MSDNIICVCVIFFAFFAGIAIGHKTAINGLCDQHKINAVYMCVEQKDVK